jgi:hypothetical protein
MKSTYTTTKTDRKGLGGLSLIFLASLCFIITPMLASAQQNGADFPQKVQPPPAVTYRNYANLSDLLTVLCDEADHKFKDFYGSGLVQVEPFITIGEFQRNKISELGITLADQMIAVINNDTRDAKADGANTTPQQLYGVIQEVDGYLRIHIAGVNSRGQRTSYVTNVEMSEPIYRALHTFI